MLCEMCHAKEACSHIYTNVNGKLKELNLCYDCADKNGFISKHFDFKTAKILTNLLENIKSEKSLIMKQCPSCGMTLSEFSSTGKIGCAKCYDVFCDELIPMMEKIHGVSTHVKRSDHVNQTIKLMGLKSKIKNLKIEMKCAVEAQNFERAAQIRDEIQSLRKQVSDNEAI